MVTGIQSTGGFIINQRPLVFYYIIYYSDGTKEEQYNKKRNYKGLKFTDINQGKLEKFGLYPFSQDLAEKVTKSGTEARALPFLPEYEIEFDGNKRLIYYRQCFISQQEYHICSSCKQEFKYDSEVKTLQSKYPSPICPNCGAHDDFFCKKCNKEYLFEGTASGLCPTCRGYLERRKKTSTQYSREKRWNLYCIGKQCTINGKNIKTLLTISENGDCKVTN